MDYRKCKWDNKNKNNGNLILGLDVSTKTIGIALFEDIGGFDETYTIYEDNILINGISKANDSAQSFINVFKNTLPQENQIQNITPSSSDGFLSFTFKEKETCLASIFPILNPS